MSTRERLREPSGDAAPLHPTAGAGDAPGVPSAAERARRLLAAADAAIERALSEDSGRFLAENRQVGGE